jgi:autotransporter-associated beta strand protein
MRTKPTVFLLGLLLSAAGVCSAAPGQWIWDPGKTGGASPGGSGNWDTNAADTFWYNGTADAAWTQTSTTLGLNSAIFNGPGGTVTLGGQIAVTNVSGATSISINSSGYTFNSGTLYIGANNALYVAPGNSVTFNCNIAGSGTSPYWILDSGATMNVAGNITTGQQCRLTGPTNSAFNLSGTANAPSIMFVLGPVNMTGGTLTAGNNFFIGYPDPTSFDGAAYSAGSLTMTNATLNENSGLFIIARTFGTPAVAGQGVFNIQNGSLVNIGTSKAEGLDLCYSAGAGENATVNVQGGTLNVGSPSFATTQIAFFPSAASVPGSVAALNVSGGAVNAWGGVSVAPHGGSGGSVTMTESNGSFNVGPAGIVEGSGYNGILNISLTGGTVGDLAAPGWSSSLPVTLGANGNVVFNPNYNISLSGSLSGPGGLSVASGTLTLSGTNNYSGTTTISNGTLAVVTSATPTASGPVTLDASVGSPALTINVSAGQYWAAGGPLTFQNGSSAAIGFQFGVLPPSSSVAPLQVAGNVSFGITPNVVIGGASVAAGTYPLIKYTGSVSGAMPGSVSSFSGSASAGYLTNLEASKTIALVVTGSSYNPGLYWADGNGTWDINTTADWTQSNSPAKYLDGEAVVFDDSATGTSPSIALNTTVNPLSVTFNNSAKNYSISGSGSIAGSAGVSLLGSGTATLATANTYSGGTTLSSGQLNINNAGTGSSSAIGTGQLIINGGAIDNTSGSDEVLQPVITEVWNGNFAYIGASNSLNTGAGGITMNVNAAINVGANDFTVGGSISDNGDNLSLTKNGNGTLTLATGNNFGGGLTLNAGLLNMGDPGAAGGGIFTINGGSIDNISGSEFELGQLSYVWGGNFSVLNSANIDFGQGNIVVPVGPGSVTVDVVANAMSTYGAIVSGNTPIVKSGQGTWNIFGSGTGENLQLTVNAGQVNFAKTSGQSIGPGSIGLTIQSGGIVVDENSFQVHSDSPATPVPINLSGGVWDLNGWSENVDKLFISNGGTLRVGANGVESGGASSTLTLVSGYMASLTGTNCLFDVEGSESLTIRGSIGGTGTLVLTGTGTLNLSNASVYTGGTVISNGTLALPGGGSIADTSAINLLTAGATLDLSGNTNSQTLAVQNGQTLAGFGTVKGSIQSSGSGTVAPGSAGVVGTLTVTGSGNSLGGITAMKLDKGHLTSDQIAFAGSVSYAGVLQLSNLSGSLAVGDSFTLFPGASGYSGGFVSITPPSPGSGLAWDTSNLAVNGTLGIKVGPALPPGFSMIHSSGSSLSIQGTNGTAGHQFVLLTSTNIAMPVTNWIPVLTNNFDTNGDFNVSVNATNPVQFLLIKTQ